MFLVNVLSLSLVIPFILKLVVVCILVYEQSNNYSTFFTGNSMVVCKYKPISTFITWNSQRFFHVDDQVQLTIFMKQFKTVKEYYYFYSEKVWVDVEMYI